MTSSAGKTTIDLAKARAAKIGAEDYDPIYRQAITLAHERNILRRTLKALLPLIGSETLRRIIEDEITGLENGK